MFRILTHQDFTTTPWRNGGGVTHEIAREGGADWRWRLSIAEVATDGPFSLFAGMQRILTVIEGPGIDLVTADTTIPARPLAPVAFSGDLAIDGRLMGGAIRDLNVIFDPKVFAARVDLLPVGQTTPGLTLTCALLSLSGAVAAEGRPVAPGTVALGQIAEVRLGQGAQALLVQLTPV